MISFVKTALLDHVVFTAMRIALIVGTIIVLINHGATIMNNSLSVGNIIEIILTYMVPYFVSTYASVKALQQ